MTTREFLEAVINTEAVATNVKEFAKEQIVKLNERNTKRSSKLTKTQLANENVKNEILKILTNEPMVASAIAEKIGISTQKASALCRQMVENGTIKKIEIKVPKKGTQLGYLVEVE